MKPLIKSLLLLGLILFVSLFIIMEILDAALGMAGPMVKLNVFLLAYNIFIPLSVYKSSKYLELEDVGKRVAAAATVCVFYNFAYCMKFIPVINRMIEDGDKVPVFFHTFVFAFLPALIISYFFSYVVGVTAARRRDV